MGSYGCYIFSMNYREIDKRVLSEDNHLLFFDKPAGLLCQKDKTNDDSVLEIVSSYLKEKYQKPGNVFLGLPHRIDRPTTGILCLCKTSKSLSRMTNLFRERKANKIYHCIVLGHPNIPTQVLKSYLRKNPQTNKTTVSDTPRENYKEALLEYKVLNRIGENTLLEVELMTGRSHQIRAQLSHIGLPIMGDLKYGVLSPLRDKSIALHAYSLDFVHPVKKESIEVKASYPDKPWWKPFV